MRTCLKCHEEKPLEAFNADRSRKDGRHPYCKPCKRAGGKPRAKSVVLEVPDGYKRCTKCREARPFALFEGFARSPDKHHPRCRDCRRLSRKAYYQKNKEKIADYFKNYREDALREGIDYSRRSRYNLTSVQYEHLLEEQGHVCSGCGDPGAGNVDHDHACCPGNRSCGECVRGILCRDCNWVLGAVKDNPEILDALAAYLVRWRNDHQSVR